MAGGRSARPDALFDDGALDDGGAPEHQHLQKPPAGGIELNHHAPARDALGVQIVNQIAHLEAVGGAPEGAPEERLDAGRQFTEAEGLHDVVVGAPDEARHAVFDGVAGRQHQNRDLHPPASETPAERHAVDVGKTHVQNDQVEPRVALQALDRRRPRRRGFDGPAAHFKVVAHVHEDVDVVVDQKNLDGHLAGDSWVWFVVRVLGSGSGVRFGVRGVNRMSGSGFGFRGSRVVASTVAAPASKPAGARRPLRGA